MLVLEYHYGVTGYVKYENKDPGNFEFDIIGKNFDNDNVQHKLLKIILFVGGQH